MGTPGNFLPKLGTPTTIFLAHDPPRGRMVVFRYDPTPRSRILIYEERASITPAEFHEETKEKGIRVIHVRGNVEAIASSGENCGRTAIETNVEWLEGRILFSFRARNVDLAHSRRLIEQI